MKEIKGPGILLGQFLTEEEPFNNLKSICNWAKGLGYRGVQLPAWDKRCLDLALAAESRDYADEIRGIVHETGLEITELATHLIGQLVAVHPSYDLLFDGFADRSVRKNPKLRQEWAVQQMHYAAKASRNLGLNACGSFSGALIWHTVYPWPQRPAGLVEAAFSELSKRWRPILDAFDEYGVDVCYELHPGEDLHDGITFERFLEKIDFHPRANILYDPSHFVLQCMDYLAFIDHYHDRIKMFHVKDAEFTPSGKQGVYGGYSEWVERAGRFRSLGDGQVDFKAVFSKLTAYDFTGWAVLEWECALKHPEAGAAEGAKFIREHIIPVTDRTFDDFVQVGANELLNKQLLAI